jgi:hypothetical protein
MRRIETKVVVNPAGVGTIRVPEDVKPGTHEAILLLEDDVRRLGPRDTLFPAPLGMIKITGDIIDPLNTEWDAMR